MTQNYADKTRIRLPMVAYTLSDMDTDFDGTQP